MKPIISLLLLIALAGGIYLLVLDGEESDSPTPPDGLTPPDTTAATGDAGSDSNRSATLAAASREQPTQLPQLARLKTSASVLFIGNNADGWTGTVTKTFGRLTDLAYASWFLELSVRGGLGGVRPGAGLRRTLPELQARPTGEYLEANDIRALFIDSIDPNALGMPFWEVVSRRVKSGRMGLYVRPNFPPAPGPNLPRAAVHPMLTHPILKGLLPVRSAKAIRGTPQPGTYSRAPQALRITEAGTRHPATRLVSNRSDSQNAWNGAATGPGALATKFVYPVESPRTGPQVLIDMDNGDYPAVIVSGSGEGADTTRVLWMGNGDFGFRTHFANDKRKLQDILISHMLLWLINQAD